MAENTAQEDTKAKSMNFVEEEVWNDLQSGRNGGRINTRFPPEPNGYLHIGHAKAICMDFGIAERFGGTCNLRFDDTNPVKEDVEYVDSIRDDIHWLGFDWGDREYYASDYFPQMYEYAVELIKKGLAYVCELSPEEFKEHRGTIGVPATSPWRDRPIEESLDLFERMKNGEFENGKYTLRAKIDLASGNFNMRDPVIYRINHAHHHRQGDKWCIYPMYDFAHPIEDALEGITHSLCSLEFEDHRPLYDWVINNTDVPSKPRQIEFARLGINYTVMSKRKLRRLVEEQYVSGWDDPRMPTICGLRRRGYTPESIRMFAEKVGVAKRDNVIDLGLLEWCVREDLNKTALRRMAVLNPLKVVITNYPEGQVEQIECVNNPEDESAGRRCVPFSREIYIERDDFMEEPPKKFFRLRPGGEVRLRYGYLIKCDEVVKDPATGEITELRCTYDPLSLGGGSSDGRKVKGIIHWVSAAHAVPAEVRLFDRLFAVESPDEVQTEGGSFLDNLNPDSLKTVQAYCEPALADAVPGDKFQFERLGYFCADSDSKPGAPVFNRTVGLKDSWAKIAAK